MIQFALAMPLVLLVIFGLIEFSLLFFMFVSTSDAAREEARCAITLPDLGTLSASDINRDCKISPISDLVTTVSCDPGLNNGNCSSTADSHTVVVTATYSYPMFLAKVAGGPGSISLQGVATMQTEQ